ncbi:bifunctional 2-polyprenyl-6-hydroxyphenol methylase/3-demethylubiquinol 3-O-methyltransferase UbiG [Nocardiopsis sp. MG754419]|uniref:class I SAM-dependent methyltransferase n=1 Tax=Nocardiopsis sp. MG754419 TaxID=2259865 RepID=UPI001BADE01C|nr:class I SAM-dependent methyltransferase [Nocardiopsis sp. MG754419]MBR8741396.1 SAM-dependent methyltransferase [Nocardiopsis sp. MG754419]
MSGGYGLGNPSSAFGARGVAKRIGAVARQLPTCGDRLLDVGCGDGTYTVALAEGYARVDAVDVEPGRLDAFAARVAGTDLEDRVEVHKMSADTLAFEDGAFDRVTAFEVLEHLDHLEESVAEIHRVLAPGGAFSLTTPNRWFPFETHGVLWGDRRRSALTAPFLPWVRPLHERMSDARAFTTQEMGRLLRDAGLRVRAIDYLMPPFDRRPRAFQTVADGLESTPARVFGMAMVVTAVKPGL